VFNQWRAWLRRFAFERGPELALGLFFIIFLLIYFSPNIFYNIQPGFYGVLWLRFSGGTVLDKVYGEGIHVIAPWNKIYIYDGRVQMQDQDFDVLSSNGLSISVNIAYRFELVPDKIPALNKYVGPEYQTILVTPEIGARARDVFSRNLPEEIFSERREVLEKNIADQVQKHLDEAFNPPWANGNVRFVKIWDVLIRSIKLPPALASAIEQKNEEQQKNEAFDFRLLLEAKEAERKRIEAHGIKEFQDIVAPGLTENYLKWQGIQATQALATSSNAKIIVIGGGGANGLPVILNTGEAGNGVPPNFVPGAAAAVSAAGAVAPPPKGDGPPLLPPASALPAPSLASPALAAPPAAPASASPPSMPPAGGLTTPAPMPPGGVGHP
jgi:prohibitin 2